MSTTTFLETEPTSIKRVIAASSIGNFVEWFDFAVYGFLASTITKVFFPESTSTVGLLKTFAVFAVAFAFRLLGGIFFGIIGDKIGRKRTLALTIIIMASATTLIGLLPTYSAIGAFSAFLLTAIRCVQGFSAGGEYAGACAYVMEHAPHGRRAFYGSFVPVATFSSFACAAIAAYVLEANLSSEQMVAWGWRVPFLIAAPVGLIGLYLRLNLDETPAFKEVAKEEANHVSLASTLRSQISNIIKLGAFVSLTALSFYFFTTYFATYLHVSGHFTQSTSLALTVMALFFAAAISPVLGWFSDTVGRPTTIATTGLLIIITVYPALTLGASGQVGYAFIGLILLSIGAAMSGVVTAPLMSEVFTTPVRYTASAITYNLAYTIFGGTAPFIATWLISYTGNNTSPAYYLIAISVMALAGGLQLKNCFHGPLRHQ